MLFAIDLSNACIELDEGASAESLIRRFLRPENSLSSRDRAILLADLASSLASRGEFKEAEPIYKEAAGFEAEENEEFQERTVIALSNLSTIYMQMKRFAEERAYSERARAPLGAMSNPPAMLAFKHW